MSVLNQLHNGNGLSHITHVANAFSSAEKTYATHATMQREVAKWLSDYVLAHATGLEKNKTILDIGSGTGFMSECLPEHSFICVDIAQGLLKQCASKPNIKQTILADMHTLPFSNQYINTACANLALQWSQHPPDVFKQVARVLKPEGELFFTVPLQGSLKEIEHCWQSSGHKSPINALYSISDWAQWATQSGLTIKNKTSKNFVQYYPHPKAAFLSLKRTGAHYATHNCEAKPLTNKSAMKARIHAYNTFKQTAGFPLSFNVGLIQAVKGTT